MAALQNDLANLQLNLKEQRKLRTQLLILLKDDPPTVSSSGREGPTSPIKESTINSEMGKLSICPEKEILPATTANIPITNRTSAFGTARWHRRPT